MNDLRPSIEELIDLNAKMDERFAAQHQEITEQLATQRQRNNRAIICTASRNYRIEYENG